MVAAMAHRKRLDSLIQQAGNTPARFDLYCLPLSRRKLDYMAGNPISPDQHAKAFKVLTRAAGDMKPATDAADHAGIYRMIDEDISRAVVAMVLGKDAYGVPEAIRPILNQIIEACRHRVAKENPRPLRAGGFR